MKKNQKRFYIHFISFFLLATLAWAAKGSTPNLGYYPKPRLIVLITIDQFRADYLTRFHSRFLPAKNKLGAPGGFRFLMENGAYYPFAQTGILQNMTAPGHAMLLTGAYPYQMGIPINVWFNPETKKSEYCVEDKTPAKLLGTTVGDELKNAGFASKVISISLKDRAAILSGGHRADLALWFDSKNFQWTSSSYYLPPEGKLPAWINSLNLEIQKKKNQLYQWKAADFKHITSVGTSESLSFPLGLELTRAAAENAIDAYKLGSDETPDILAVSFSTHDFLGHAYGPNTQELEELTVLEDRQISNLFQYIQKKVPGGLSNVIFILTADHGTPPRPSWLKTVKVDAGLIDVPAALPKIENHLERKFGKSSQGKWILFQEDFNFYLNGEAIHEKKLSPSVVESELKAKILEIPGIANAFTRSEYVERKLPPGLIEKQILNTYFPARSGDVVMIPKPFYMANDYPVNHMTGYSYDRTVPLVFYGPKFKKGIYSTPADVIDIAPTLSFLLGIIPPSLSEGRVLSESIN